MSDNNDTGMDVVDPAGESARIDKEEASDLGELLIRQRIRERRREKLQKQREMEGSGVASSSLNAPQSDTQREETRHWASGGGDVSTSSNSALRGSWAESESTMPTRDAQSALAINESDIQDSVDFDGEIEDDLEYTVKDRQDAINMEHPFGLPIWKPALYKKSRSIQRTADSALKCTPGMDSVRASLPGNIVWLVLFGVWLCLLCMAGSALLYFVPYGGRMYSHTLYGLAMYLLWPFANYVEVECSHSGGHRHGPCRLPMVHEHEVKDDGTEDLDHNELPADERSNADETSSLAPSEDALRAMYGGVEDDEGDSPMTESERISREKRLYHYVYDDNGNDIGVAERWGGIVAYALFYGLFLFPALGLVCLVCWGLVVTVPMAKLSWALLKNMAKQPLALHFRSPLHIDTRVLKVYGSEDRSHMKNVLNPGNLAPRVKRGYRKKGTSKRRSIVLLCTYKAMGREYFKYTVGGVNILFVNTLPIVFFTLGLYFVLRPLAVHYDLKEGLLASLVSDGFIFVMALASVLPLSYFIGMAVASISTQSSIGMGAVINATFGSIIELILYSLALTEGKASLVEGSIIGSILAGVLLMPGISMCSGATRRKEQTFNSRSAGVTSTMLIMAIIGILTPTLFYQIYGKFELECSGCPSDVKTAADSWKCDQCSFERMSPLEDPFFHSNVKGLIYTCAAILLLAYGIGLWFSLRTHASQIWNSAPHVATNEDLPAFRRASIYKRLLPPQSDAALPLHHDPAAARMLESHSSLTSEPRPSSPNVSDNVRQSLPETLQETSHNAKAGKEEAVRVAVARMYHYLFNQQQLGDAQEETSKGAAPQEPAGSGGHEAPSWSRYVSMSVLLSCTVLYAMIAEVIVGVVDVVVRGLGLPEKFVGVTIFALVPNTTEFMNAMSFAINGNIALSLEIGSAYALQVCLIQIPVLVGFSALYNGSYSPKSGVDLASHAFTLLFPRWDTIAIILSVFLLTYTYNEARSNYHRGSILVLAYLVFVLGFFFAPSFDPEDPAQAGVTRFATN